jgi:putative sterol carrier protein
MSAETHDTVPTPQRLIEQLPERLRPDVAGRTKLTVQLDLSGDDGGQWWVRVADGRCTIGAGRVDKPDVVLRASATDYARIRLGHLDALTATMNGQLKVEGKYGLAVKFAKLFRTGP